MVAMICGCSLRIRSATDCASIHFRLSMPLASRWPRIRFNSEAALSSPSALVSTVRIYSSESMPSEVFCSVWLRKSSSTVSSSSLCTDFIVDMAAPSFCTSRGPRYFMTSAASSSPSASIRIAPFCIPASLISAHPCLDYVSYHFRVLPGQLLGRFQIVLICARGGPHRLYFADLEHGVLVAGGPKRRPRGKAPHEKEERRAET